MERQFLEDCLAQGMSLDVIGERVGRHPSTVGYWVKKLGLSAANATRNAKRGALDKQDLESLVDAGMTIRQIADRLDRSPTTVRHWLRKHAISVATGPRSRLSEGQKRAIFECPRHGETTFIREGRGYFRCGACRVERVARRRRAVKAKLVEEAGGRCIVCGYDRCQQGLQFHHLDPDTKEFHLGCSGLTRSLTKARAEANKCVLLCANCHAEVEAGLTQLSVDGELPVNSDE